MVISIHKIACLTSFILFYFDAVSFSPEDLTLDKAPENNIYLSITRLNNTFMIWVINQDRLFKAILKVFSQLPSESDQNRKTIKVCLYKVRHFIFR